MEKVSIFGETGHYQVASFRDELKHASVAANKRQITGEQHEQNYSTTPHVHRLRIRQSLHNLGGHIARRADAPARYQRVAIVVVGQLD